ncbi:hypothetical protein KY290_026204 [Solanum tuberosum]|uniref:Uncharacterized protein n=1 Tax=Solanum tuberosum TaxID=4113 RepID=A0ABQ7UXE0_SOLTU|nr:hypothetical protein KY289_025284 [Solanum tuberosum]KAH0673960.1 hypothetical protein KY284_025047 [Solanum tuberosum]KAH0677252.1 hypothetical protein KY285_025053 [Solanum tuberosum]KAH0755934.1 hypothetical protein KY290_026204 [Solanum tuberosum]
MMENNEYVVSFKNLIDKVYHRSMDLFQFQTQLTCHINSHITGAEVAAKIAAAQFSASQAAASAAHAAASAAEAAASVVQAAASAAQVAASATQASATVADQEAATVGADEVVNESAGIRFWNKTKACLGHAIHLLVICTAAAGDCA